MSVCGSGAVRNIVHFVKALRTPERVFWTLVTTSVLRFCFKDPRLPLYHLSCVPQVNCVTSETQKPALFLFVCLFFFKRLHLGLGVKVWQLKKIKSKKKKSKQVLVKIATLKQSVMVLVYNSSDMRLLRIITCNNYILIRKEIRTKKDKIFLFLR